MSLLRPIRDTWSTSIGVARERLRVGGLRRIVVDWAVQAAVLLIVGHLVPGILVETVAAALFGAVVLGLLNALVRPVIILLTLPLNVVTVGLLSLVVNAMMLTLAAPLVPGFEVTSFAGAFAAAVVITILTTLISVVVSSDRDDTFYAELARRLAAMEGPHVRGGTGLLIVQIDGLGAPILRNAIRVGLTPRMASWVRSGRYRLVEWDCAPPSQTSASQAGILHGSNDGIPAFRWYEKEHGRLMVSNRPADAAEIERRVSNGKGLLAAGGTSVGNLFSGDAERSLFTMSTIGRGRPADVDAFSLYFVDPSAFIRTVVLAISEFAKELIEARRQRVLDIQPRVHRGLAFSGMRAVSNVVLRDLNVTFLMHAMGRGVPIMYVDFVDYDELAHHAGPERLESLRSLTGVDQALASLERAIAGAPRDYSIVVLSDHGQSQGATFRQRYGSTLDEVIRALMGGDVTAVTATSEGEGWGPVNALLGEIRQRPGIAGRMASSALEGRTVDGAVDIGRRAEPTTVAKDGADLVVGPSGNLANVYFTALPGRATLEEIDERHPGLVAGLAAHPGIGFVLVRTVALGSVAIGRAGVHHLADGRVDGDDPLAPFGPRAADHLRRIDGFDHVGDLLVNSSYDADLDEVAAFEELVGSHGGFGGPQTRPFVLAPTTLPFDEEPLVGAPAVHRQLVRWADLLGVGPESGATARPTVETALARPRAIGAVAALIALGGIMSLLLGLAALGVGALATDPAAAAGAASVLVVGAVFTGLGVAGLAVAIGLLRRRRWAWMATLVLEGLTVVQILLAVAASGVSGILGFGMLQVASAPLVFFYLTRPHVAAAFGRHARGTVPGSTGTAPPVP